MKLLDLLIVNTKLLLFATRMQTGIAMGSRHTALQLRYRRVYFRVADEVAEKLGGEVGLG